MHLRTDHGSPLRHGHRGVSLARERHRRFQSVLIAGIYPWNDPRWRFRLYGTPCPYFYYRPAGCELVSEMVGSKLRWRRAFHSR